MIAIDELDLISKARLEDAEALFQAGRYDAAIYLCGYAVELTLKARICRTLGWAGYPETNSEFRDYRTYRTHNLNVLLHLSGIEAHLMANFRGEWASISNWNPELRYLPIGSASVERALSMIESTRVLVEEI